MGRPRKYVPAEGHVFLRMGHAWEARGRIVAARKIILLDGDNWGQRIAHKDHAQTVIEGWAHDGIARGLLRGGYTGQ